MLLMHANNREDIKEAFAGDIVALAGLKDARTGDTLCDPQQAGDPGKNGIPRAGHRALDRAQDKADQEKLGVAPPRVAQEDPSSASPPTMNRSKRS